MTSTGEAQVGGSKARTGVTIGTMVPGLRVADLSVTGMGAATVVGYERPATVRNGGSRVKAQLEL